MEEQVRLHFLEVQNELASLRVCGDLPKVRRIVTRAEQGLHGCRVDRAPKKAALELFFNRAEIDLVLRHMRAKKIGLPTSVLKLDGVIV